MRIQEIAVALLLLLAIGYIGWKVYRFITRATSDPCAGCTGCALKDQMKDKKQSNCTEKGASPKR